MILLNYYFINDYGSGKFCSDFMIYSMLLYLFSLKGCIKNIFCIKIVFFYWSFNF